MNLSTLVTSVVVVIGGVGALAISDVGTGVIGMLKHDVGASVSSRGATVAMIADLPRVPDTMHAAEVTPALVTPPTLVTGDSRLDNYQLERDSCCSGEK